MAGPEASISRGSLQLLKDSDLPLEFWDEAVETNVYFRNRTQTGPLVDGVQISPEEAFTVNVDDIAAAVTKTEDLLWFFNKLSSRFNAKNLGESEKILGIKVTRNRANRTIFLDQEQYLRAMPERFGMTASKFKLKKILAADYEALRPANAEDRRIDTSEYQQEIGSLMSAMVLTRPDIAIVLGKLSQFMSDPAEHHGHALKELFRYLRSTVSQKRRSGPRGEYDHFVVFSDARWTSDKSDRKSLSGSVAIFYGGPISWFSKKQRSVATSSCESEYMALSARAK
ncbi:hypothetical protein K3495_g6791 [Podosphaera aphanis]|nr:hypothetical protein K3495_g6791 [Podosphaera aphanis]